MFSNKIPIFEGRYLTTKFEISKVHKLHFMAQCCARKMNPDVLLILLNTVQGRTLIMYANLLVHLFTFLN